MNANDYMNGALSTAKYPDYAKIIYPLLGLAGETHEVFEKLFKIMYPDGKPKGWTQVDSKNKEFCRILNDVVYVGKEAEVFKKIIRDKNGELPENCFNDVAERLKGVTDEQREDLKKELGDIAWYLAVLSHDLGLDLESVMKANYDKLQSRKERGVIGGSGDSR